MGPGQHRAVELWDVATGDHLASLTGHTGPVEDVAFSPDGARLATASFDRTVWLWDSATGDQLLVLHSPIATVSSVSFHPDGTRLASTGPDGTVRVWALDLDDLVDVAEEELTRTLTDEECRQYLHVPRCPAA